MSAAKEGSSVLYNRARFRRRNPLAAGCGTFICGCIFLLFGILFVRDTLSFLPGTLTTSGVITHCDYNNNNDTSDAITGSSSCTPTVKFQTKSGQTISFISSESAAWFHQNDTVTVRYHPQTPNDGRIDSFLSTWLIPLIACGVGLLVLLMSPFILLRAIIRRLRGFPY